MPTISINYLAVFVTTIISMGIGALWYSPLLFGKLWMKLTGITTQDMDKAKKKGMAKNYIIGFVSTLLMIYILSHFVDYTEAKTPIQGALTGFWLWLGFIATTSINTVLWEGKPLKLYILNNAHILVILILMGTILAVWV